ncbi:MAG: hypothetical protein EOP54_13655 [Sphingobacteriales bacterium]|nr:MAG: hypothetical protein EOP54_13655 [Sphingobacteriales bacterium]
MFSFALVAIMGLTFAFKPFSKEDKKAKRLMYTFKYNGSNFSESAVENPANWTYTASTDLCNGALVKPCRIQVSETYVDNPSTTPTLKSAINIVAAENTGTSTHYVDEIADEEGVVSNRPF